MSQNMSLFCKQLLPFSNFNKKQYGFMSSILKITKKTSLNIDTSEFPNYTKKRTFDFFRGFVQMTVNL